MKLQKFEMRPDWEPTLGTSLERQRSLLNPGGFIGSITATSGPQKFEMCPVWGAKSSGGVSFREYLLQRPQRGGERLC